VKKRELTKFRESYTPWLYECPAEGLKLAVHFDEKEQVKQLGARWNPDPSGKGGYWWMPQSRCTDERLVYLNDQKMILGLHGSIEATAAEEITAEMHSERFILSDGASEYAVMRFADIGLVRFKEAMSGATWYSEVEGKAEWENLVGAGFYRLSEESV